MGNNLLNIEREFEKMKEHVNKVFSDMSFNDGFNLSFKQPDCDVYETDKQVVCKFDVPGVSKSDIKLSVNEGYIELKAEKSTEVQEDDKKKGHRTERNYTGFYRKFLLPHAVDERDVDAKFENGTLVVKLNKVEKEKHSDNLIEIK